MKKQREGITLIALVITIIILLILVGITINLTIGQRGILKRTEEAEIAYKESEAREKLELVLLDMQAEKVINSNEYDSINYLNKKIEQKGMIVNGDVVIVDGWQFIINRDIPEIVENLGKGELNEEIKIAIEQMIREDYVKSTLTVQIEYEGKLSSIKIGEEVVEIPEQEEGKYVIVKEIINNGVYSIVVKDENNKYQIGREEVTELTEDMEIWTAEDMKLFQERVNTGRTYEGRVARVMQDIDLKGNENNQWIPIGTEDMKFKGTFEGNFKTINNLYINSNQYMSIGLFSFNYGIIQDVILNNVNINNHYANDTKGYSAGIVGKNYGIIKNSGINSGNINYDVEQSNQESYLYAGGICGNNEKEINACYNRATIIFKENNQYAEVRVFAGGIAGGNQPENSQIINCYNNGIIKIKGGSNSSGGGIAGMNVSNGVIENSYNYGMVLRNLNELIGGIVGRIISGEINGKIINSYCTSSQEYSYHDNFTGIGKTDGILDERTLKTYASKLGDAFVNDLQNEDETWKYNNGYPTLKWQLKVK